MTTDNQDHLVVLGPTCTDHGCRAVARWTTYWPGSTLIKCTAHRDGWAKIATVMGFELVSRPLDVATGEDDASKRFSMMELE